MSNLNKLKETQVPEIEYNENLEKKKINSNKPTTIRVTTRARDLVNAYKYLTGASNPSEVLENIILNAVADLPPGQQEAFKILLANQNKKD